MTRTDKFGFRPRGVISLLGALLILISVYAMGRQEIRSLQEPMEDYGHLPSDLAQKVVQLEKEIVASSNPEEKTRNVAELVRLYGEAERQDLAAEVQRSLAEVQNTAGAWDLAGNLYFDWMLKVDGSNRVIFARYAIDAYLSSLEIEPNDLGVQTDLGAAFLHYPGYLKKAIETTNRVLSIDPKHIQANFNLGIMLARANELERAKRQFYIVVNLTSEDDPRKGEAKASIARVESLQLAEN